MKRHLQSVTQAYTIISERERDIDPSLSVDFLKGERLTTCIDIFVVFTLFVYNHDCPMPKLLILLN